MNRHLAKGKKAKFRRQFEALMRLEKFLAHPYRTLTPEELYEFHSQAITLRKKLGIP